MMGETVEAGNRADQTPRHGVPRERWPCAAMRATCTLFLTTPISSLLASLRLDSRNAPPSDCLKFFSVLLNFAYFVDGCVVSPTNASRITNPLVWMTIAAIPAASLACTCHSSYETGAASAQVGGWGD